MGADGPQIIPPHSDPRRRDAFAGAFGASSTRKLGRREQVAAVCYRWHGDEIEFLLVHTRGGRWTFPKGGTEAGLTHAQAAAKEAFEEAGVHGRIEEIAFTRYRHRKRDKARAGECRLRVRAHLCQVLRLGRPQESGRTPTWFSQEKAKQFLRKDRTTEDATEFDRVVDHAVMRIRRLQSAASQPVDGLQEVPFEAPQQGRGIRYWKAQVARATQRAGVLLLDLHSPEALQLKNTNNDGTSPNNATSASDSVHLISQPAGQNGREPRS